MYFIWSGKVIKSISAVGSSVNNNKQFNLKRQNLWGVFKQIHKQICRRMWPEQLMGIGCLIWFNPHGAANDE